MTDLHDIQEGFHNLLQDTSERLVRYSEYLNWFRGDHELYQETKEGRPFHKTNLCSRSVRMLSNFTLSQMPELHAKRPSEFMTKHDTGEDIPDFQAEFNISELQEKVMRRILNYERQGMKEFSSGMQTGLTLGDTVLFTPFDEKLKMPRIYSIFPGHVRVKFRSNDYQDVEAAWVTRIVHVNAIKKKYGVDVPAMSSEEMTNNSIWGQDMLEQGDYTVLKTYYDDDHKVSYVGDVSLEEKKHNNGRTPWWVIPALYNPFTPWGDSYLKDIIPIQKEYNETISDESAIEKLFAHPKIILSNATQKDIDNLKHMLKTGVLASKTDLRVQFLQFSGSLFPIEQKIQKIEDRYFRTSGLGPAVFGLPPGSINTGASLTIQYAPTLQQAQIVWNSWEPVILNMLQHFAQVMKERGGKDPESGQSYGEIFKDKVEWELKAPFRIPRDEAVTINNEMTKYHMGQSRNRTFTNLGIESPEDELVLRTWEDLVLRQLLPQQVSQGQQQQSQSPFAAAQQGGRISAAQAALGAAQRPQ